MRNVIRRAAAATAGLLLAAAVLATTVPVGAAGAVGIAAAPTVPAPGWRVSMVFSGAQNMTSVVATSASDAWSSWWIPGPAGPAPFVERWNGSAWRQVPVPSGLTDLIIDPLAVGASSASDLWEFIGSIAGPPPAALRWNGRTWRLQQLPGWVIRASPDPAGDLNAQTAVFGPGDVWVFSTGVEGTNNPDHFAARYNGRAWVKVPLPAVSQWISALAPNDIWGKGAAAAGRHPDILMHWNGKRWTTTPPLPAVQLPPGAIAFADDLTATGPRDAWLDRGILPRSGNNEALYLLHWNGTRWAHVRFGFPVSQVDFMAQDGHGGLWLADQGPAPARHWYLDHLSFGRWTRYAVPAVQGTTLQDLSGIAWIPGTRSMWATGDLAGPPKGHGSLGLVLKFGP
jgi:hypothetical protein